MSLSSCFKYHTFTKKCEELLIVLHSLYEKLPNRVFVREVGGMKIPFVWIPRHELLKEVTYQDRTLLHVIKFLSDHGLIIIEKVDFLPKCKTNCYAINYKMIKACLDHWGYTPQGIRPHSDKAPLEALFDFDVMEIIKKVPGFKQRPGRYKYRKGVVNRSGNCKPKALLEDPESKLARSFCALSNPLRGYLYHIARDEVVDNPVAQRLRYGSARYATLCYQENTSSVGELIYQMGLTLEQVVKGSAKGFASVFDEPRHKRKRWVDLQRPKEFFKLVGAIFKKEIFYPSRANIQKFATWIKEKLDGNLTEALKFRNIFLFAKTLKNTYKRRTMKKKPVEGSKLQSPDTQTIEEKLEQLQYAIAENPNETRLQKEARLTLLNKMGPLNYSAWIKDLNFHGESDYLFDVKTRFHSDYLTTRYSYGTYHFEVCRPTLELYR